MIVLMSPKAMLIAASDETWETVLVNICCVGLKR